MNWKWYALGSAVFAGLTAVLGKIGVQNIPSNLATFFRTIVILLFLAALLSARGEWQSPSGMPVRSLVFLGLSGLATGLSWICYYRALQLAPASLVAPIDKLSLVFAVILAVIFLGERLSTIQWVGTAFVAAGTILLIFK